MSSSRTLIIAILDASGSMENQLTSYVSGINKFFSEQLEINNNALFNIVLFDDEINVLYDCFKSILSYKPFTEESYLMGGMTSIYDAIAKGITETDNYISTNSDQNFNVIVVVQTDGIDVSSQQFNQKQVAKMIGERESWKFLFIGASEDCVLQAMQMGIKSDNALVYQETMDGIASAYRFVSDCAILPPPLPPALRPVFDFVAGKK